MCTVIYVDVLLTVNLLLTYVLLLLTCLFMKTEVKKSRMLAGSATGALFSLTLLLPDIGVVPASVLKITMCMIIVAITFQFRSIKQIVKYCLCFLFVNAALAGMILLLQNWGLNAIILYHNANVYCNVNLAVLLGFSVLCYAILKIIFVLLLRNENKQICTVKIYLNGACAECRAMVDTGNSLSDPISGSCVSVVSYSVTEPLFSSSLQPFFHGDFSCQTDLLASDNVKISLIHATFAQGNTVLPAFVCDRLVVQAGKQEQSYKHCVLAVTTNTFENEAYKMLLHPQLAAEQIISVKESENEIEIA